MSLVDSDEFHVIYRKGKVLSIRERPSHNLTHSPVTGGIFRQTDLTAPTPTDPPSSIIVKREIKSPIFTVYVKHLDADTAHFVHAKTNALNAADHIASIERLLELLRHLPPQFVRRDSEDLYGRDASLMRITCPAELVDFIRDQWEIPRPTEEQKVMFGEAMAIIDKWAE